jgi:hypothetical protein
LRGASNLFGLLNEVVFTLAGALLLWVALTGAYLFDPRRPSWLVLAVVLILWGLRALRRARLIAVAKLRLAARIGGASLVIVGLIMLTLSWMPLGWIGMLLAIAGGIFVARGLVAAAILVSAS